MTEEQLKAHPLVNERYRLVRSVIRRGQMFCGFLQRSPFLVRNHLVQIGFSTCDPGLLSRV
jgi:hypothetical protein